MLKCPICAEKLRYINENIFCCVQCNVDFINKDGKLEEVKK